MLSTGNLPDVILGMKLSSNDVSSYGEDGTFLMLDDYIETYGVETKKVMEEMPGMLICSICFHREAPSMEAAS